MPTQIAFSAATRVRPSCQLSMVGALEEVPRVLLVAADHVGTWRRSLRGRRGPAASVGRASDRQRYASPQARFAYASRPPSTQPAGSERPGINPEDAHNRQSKVKTLHLQGFEVPLRGFEPRFPP